jgi:type I restriction enzyme S subunit
MMSATQTRKNLKSEDQGTAAKPKGPANPSHSSSSGEWPFVSLGELCRLINGDAYRESDWSSKGIPIIRIQNLNNPSKPFNHWAGPTDKLVKVKDGDLLFAWSGTPGTSFGAHFWERGPGLLNQHIFRVDLDRERLCPEWARFSINHGLEDLIGKAHGAVGLRHVTKRECEAIPIPLPPLTEQRHLAAQLRGQLTAVAEARAALQSQLKAAAALPAAYLREVFDAKASSLSRNRLGDVLRLRNDIAHPRDKPTGKARFVGLEHIEPHTGRRIGEDSVQFEDLTGRKARFEKGDIVYGYLRPYLNKVWLADFAGICSVDQYVYRVREDVADAAYVASFMRSPCYLTTAPTAATPGQLPRIRTEEVAKVLIPLPPLPEQRAIAARLDDSFARVATLRTSLEARLAAVDRLPAALLREVFGG